MPVRRGYVVPDDDVRCWGSVTQPDGTGARCMRRAANGSQYCHKHSAVMEEDAMSDSKRVRWQVFRDQTLHTSFSPNTTERAALAAVRKLSKARPSPLFTLYHGYDKVAVFSAGENLTEYGDNPPRQSHARVKSRLTGGSRRARGPVKVGGYLDAKGNVLNSDGHPTGWRVAYDVAVYRVPEVLSWMTSTAKAVVLTKGNRKGVALSYGDALILRGVEVPRDMSSEELRMEAETEAEHWLSLDIAEAEEQAEREQEAEE